MSTTYEFRCSDHVVNHRGREVGGMAQPCVACGRLTSMREPVGQPLHGCQLIAAFPSLRDGDSIGPRWIVVVDRGEDIRDRYVSGWVLSLDSPTWDIGRYRDNLGDAIRDALERVGYEVAPIRIF